VRAELGRAGEDQVEVRGALCFSDVDGLPMFAELSVRDVVVDGPRPVAKLAGRPGPLDGETVERIWRQLGSSFPRASERS
jgi:hypothetical protein